MSKWSYKVKASPHVTAKRSVVVACGPPSFEFDTATMPPLVLPQVGRPPAVLSYAKQHLWLGLLWSSSLEVSRAMEHILGKTSSKFATLARLCASCVLPLCFFLEFFESVAEGALRFGRWLHAVDDSAAERLDKLNQRSAR